MGSRGEYGVRLRRCYFVEGNRIGSKSVVDTCVAQRECRRLWLS